MKKLVALFIFLFVTSITIAQSNDEIAGVYIKRANKVIEESVDYREAKVLFEKAMKYTDSVTSQEVAKLGARIYYELEDYKKAKAFSKQYFLIAKTKKKKDKDYDDQLLLSTYIDEELELVLAEEKRIATEKRKKARELQIIDSLKTAWNNKAKALAFKADSIHKFNKFKVALYTLNGNYGLVSDTGETLVKANEFKDYIAFDGYIVLKNKANNPNKLYCYNAVTKTGYLLPSVTDIYSWSSHFGKVMLPRANGRLVTYPDNSDKPLVFDLNFKKATAIKGGEDNLLKKLKKADVIDKFNKDGEVKKDKVWYKFGVHLGNNVFSLHNTEAKKLEGFLFAVDGTLLPATSKYQFIGVFHNNKAQAISGSNILWINNYGVVVSNPTDEAATYTGTTLLKKRDDGTYQFTQDGFIILGKEKLEKMADFLRKNSPKK